MENNYVKRLAERFSTIENFRPTLDEVRPSTKKRETLITERLQHFDDLFKQNDNEERSRTSRIRKRVVCQSMKNYNGSDNAIIYELKHVFAYQKKNNERLPKISDDHLVETVHEETEIKRKSTSSNYEKRKIYREKLTLKEFLLLPPEDSYESDNDDSDFFNNETDDKDDEYVCKLDGENLEEIVQEPERHLKTMEDDLRKSLQLLNDTYNIFPTPNPKINESYSETENKPKKSMEKSIINKGKTLKRSMSLRTPKETRYSSTSTSSFEAEDVRVAVQSEIYYDNKQMPRIETVRSLKSYFKNNEHKVKKSKLHYIIKELVVTEESYVRTLKAIVDDYLNYLKTTASLEANLVKMIPIVFGNFESIYKESVKFFNDLKQCQEDCDLIAQTFLDHKDLFELYPIYSRKKPASDYVMEAHFTKILKDRQAELNQKLDLSSYLLCPIQRLGKYRLILENMKKELKQRESDVLNEAIHLIGSQLSRGNDFIAIDSIVWPKENADIITDNLGSFVMREMFNVKVTKKHEMMVYLFEKTIVFTRPLDADVFAYKCHVLLINLGLVEFENKPFMFHLRNFLNGSKKKVIKYEIEAKSNKIKTTWTEYLKKELFQQLSQEREKRLSHTLNSECDYNSSDNKVI